MRRNPVGGLAASSMSETAAASLAVSGEAGGQERSGEVQPCHLTTSIVPNDTLFMQGRAGALPSRALFAASRKRCAKDGLTENARGSPALTAARAELLTLPRPFDLRVIVHPTVLVEPLFMIVAPSSGRARLAAAPSADKRRLNTKAQDRNPAL